MKKKTLMILGGTRYIIPLIEEAHKLGVFVITVDYLPNNVAHKYSDLYLNISILDKDAVLASAKKYKIDGISSFGCDPGVLTAAYVAEKLNLPNVGPYESVRILQNKGLFRDFLAKHGFNCPLSKSFTSLDDVKKNINCFSFPIIIKPTDSAGSKGVTRVDNIDEVESAAKHAFENSYKKEIIIEEFIEKLGCSSDSDCYSLDGKLVFASFSDQHFDKNSLNPYTPSAFVWPSSMNESSREELTSELQRLLLLLKMRTSVYNVESRVSTNGKAYLMEVSPRGGGNRISELLAMRSGVNLIKHHIHDCLGIDYDQDFSPKMNKRIGEVILHSQQKGEFVGLVFDESISKKIIQTDLWVKQGDKVEPFSGANKTIGTIILSLDKDDDINFLIKKIQVQVK